MRSPLLQELEASSKKLEPRLCSIPQYRGRAVPCQVLDDVRDARRVSTAAAEAAPCPGWHGVGGGALPAKSPVDGGAQGLAADQGLADEEASERLRLRPADIICALNFSLCLLHSRRLALAYLRCGATTHRSRVKGLVSGQLARPPPQADPAPSAAACHPPRSAPPSPACTSAHFFIIFLYFEPKQKLKKP